jgi:hypothetical protein
MSSCVAIEGKFIRRYSENWSQSGAGSKVLFVVVLTTKVEDARYFERLRVDYSGWSQAF